MLQSLPNDAEFGMLTANLMKLLYAFAIALLLMPRVAMAQGSPEDRFIVIYDMIKRADSYYDASNLREALPKYQEAQSTLRQFQTDFPDWNPKIINFRLNYLAEKIKPLADSFPVVEAVTPEPKEAMASGSEQGAALDLLREQLRQAQAEKAALEAQVKVASATSRLAQEEKQALTEAQSKAKALELENSQLKIELQDQGKSAEAAAATQRTAQQLSDFRAKLAEQSGLVATLSEQNASLQKRLDAATVEDSVYSNQVATLQQQLREVEAARLDMEAQLKGAQAGNASQLSAAEEKIKNLQKENNLLRASLESRPSHTLTTVDTANAEQTRKELAELNRKVQEQAEQIADLRREKEALQKQLETVVNADALAKELADTKAELASTKLALQKLQRQFDDQTKAAVQIIADYRKKVRDQGKAAESMMKQIELLKAERAGADQSGEVTALRKENEALRLELVELRKSVARGEVSARDANADFITVQSKLAAMQAQLDVLQAKRIPWTEEELKCFRLQDAALTAEGASVNQLPPGGAEMVKEAQRLFASHLYEAAEDVYQRLLKLSPNNAFVLANLATIQIEQNHLADAEQSLSLATKLQPKDGFTLGVYGNLLLRLGRYDEAFSVLSRAAQYDPGSAEIQNTLGIALSHQGQRGAAETALRKALQLDPKYGAAHNNLAIIYVSQNPPLTELARWHYNKALTLGVARNTDLEKMIEAAASPAVK